MKYNATFRVYDNPDLAYKCFLPEIDQKKRFKLNISNKKDYVELSIDADDSVALKAITTSMIKLLQVYEELGDEDDRNE